MGFPALVDILDTSCDQILGQLGLFHLWGEEGFSVIEPEGSRGYDGDGRSLHSFKV